MAATLSAEFEVENYWVFFLMRQQPSQVIVSKCQATGTYIQRGPSAKQATTKK
jgi:hypothetical protein